MTPSAVAGAYMRVSNNQRINRRPNQTNKCRNININLAKEGTNADVFFIHIMRGIYAFGDGTLLTDSSVAVLVALFFLGRGSRLSCSRWDTTFRVANVFCYLQHTAVTK